MRVAVVSPFIDRRHGSERAIAELVERLATTYRCEVHLFAERVADLKMAAAVVPAGAARASGGSVHWHRIPTIPGPQLLRFGAWFVLNRLWRLRRAFDLVISGGINCPDAEVVIVHALFQRLTDISRAVASTEDVTLGIFRALHRRVYYLLLSALERRIYRNRAVTLAAVSHHTASLLARYFGRDDIRVIPNGVDSAVFSPASRLARRERSRSKFNVQPHEFVLLLIGNDWATKGIHTILEAMLLLRTIPVRLLIVGADVREPYAAAAERLGVLDRCIWSEPVDDVLDCYAAADAYVSPSREDSFGLPVAEAMASGLPAITSASAGVSELVTNEVNAIVLQDPRDAPALAQHIAKLHGDPSFRAAIGAAAALATQNWTWEANAAAVWQLLSEAAAMKARGPE